MIESKYNLWLQKATKDMDLIDELKAISNNNELISDAFYKELEFGTGGLRGVIGAGTNRMNIYTVGKATQGLANYVNSVTKNGCVAIGYDSRIKSDKFAKAAAEIFAANGIKVYIYKELMPTPMLSYAIRQLKCDAGVVVTASHNPAKYNGYKAYGNDGCQLGPEAADYVLEIMDKIDVFEDIKSIDFDDALKQGKIEFIDDALIEKYLKTVEDQRVEKNLDLSDLKVIYTPLNGSGNKPVRSILDMIGVKNVKVVKEQEMPDGNFPTVPFPNPEIKQAFECALELAKAEPADILLATDPDCDRVGIAIPDKNDYRLFTGNDVGALLLNYILERRTANGTLPKNPLAVKTIVSTEICKKIAAYYNCELIDVLTGFKFIGEQISILEENGEDERYILGFEESYGYLAGTHARDKDAVVASMLICEMTAYYKSIGMTLIDALDSLYKKFGYFYCAQKSFTCEGQSGMMKIKEIMADLRENVKEEIAGIKVVKFEDYKTSTSLSLPDKNKSQILLPKSDVICYYLADDSSIIVRPSGTEPKIKLYIGAVGKNSEEATEKQMKLTLEGTKLLGF